jgi:hypothetical protein
MEIRKINNVPSNIKAIVSGVNKKDLETQENFSKIFIVGTLIFVFMINYRYNAGKI